MTCFSRLLERYSSNSHRALLLSSLLLGLICFSCSDPDDFRFNVENEGSGGAAETEDEQNGSSGGSGGTLLGQSAGGNPGGLGGDSGSGGSSGGGDNESTGGNSGEHGGDFLLSFERRHPVFGSGQLLAATPNDSVVTVGPIAPSDLFPGSSGGPFLLDIESTGEILHQVTFDDAAEPELITIDDEGNIFLAGQLHKDMKFGSFQLESVEDGYFLLKLSKTMEVLQAVGVTTQETAWLNAIAVDSAGDVLLAVSRSDFDTERPALIKYSKDTLTEIWATTFEHTMTQAYSNGIITLTDDTVVVAGAYTGTLTIGDQDLTKAGGIDDGGVYNGWIAWLDPSTGNPLDAVSFGGSVFDYALGLEATEEGGFKMLAFQSDSSDVFDQSGTFDTEDGECTLLQVSMDSEVAWLTPLGGPNVFGSAMTLGDAGQTYVAGRYGRLESDAASRGARLFRIEKDGELKPTLDLSSGNPNGATDIAVDSSRGVWISGAWETPIVHSGVTYEPPSNGGQFVLRVNEF